MNRKERRAAAKRGVAPAHPPHEGESLFQLGLATLRSGQPEAASGWFNEALAFDGRIPEWHFYGAVAAQMCGRLDEAETRYRRAASLRPEFAEALASLGGLLAEQGRFDEAAAVFRRAASLRPNDAEIRRGFGRVLLAQGPSGLSSEPERALLSETILQLRHEPIGRLPEITAAAVGVIKAHPVLGPLIREAAESWPRRLPPAVLLDPAVLAAIAGDQLLGHLLRAAPLPDLALEQFFTGLRAALLDRAADAETADAPLIEVAAAVARQCFTNEYVFAVTAAETETVDRLRRRLDERLAADAEVPSLWLPVIAAYQPLHTCAGASKLLDRSWSGPIRDLLVQQIAEPAEERRLASSIAALTPIEDAVSLAVQQQYEDNPYPRWVAAMPVANPATLDEHLGTKFGTGVFRPLGQGSEINILVAGCGSGQHAIDIARQFPGSRVLAVDLSRASLAYAQRKTQELGLTHIEYGQADILELGDLARRFELIVSMGVLHHLADPFAGWRVLISLLSPGGVMNLGLYSEAARTDVVAARTAIAAKQYSATAEDIRRFRQEVIALDAAAPLRVLTRYGDFFATSDCRDLLFHVQEHRLTLPAIKDFLDANGLDFLGFDLDPRTLQAYAAAAPGDRTMTDLHRWHAFEMQNPATFRGMYQFWVQRRV